MNDDQSIIILYVPQQHLQYAEVPKLKYTSDPYANFYAFRAFSFLTIMISFFGIIILGLLAASIPSYFQYIHIVLIYYIGQGAWNMYIVYGSYSQKKAAGGMTWLMFIFMGIDSAILVTGLTLIILLIMEQTNGNVGWDPIRLANVDNAILVMLIILTTIGVIVIFGIPFAAILTMYFYINDFEERLID